MNINILKEFKLIYKKIEKHYFVIILILSIFIK